MGDLGLQRVVTELILLVGYGGVLDSDKPGLPGLPRHSPREGDFRDSRVWGPYQSMRLRMFVQLRPTSSSKSLLYNIVS